MQILIFGMHRSGTSATARVINMMGAYFGPEGCAPVFTTANPKGFWEREEVFLLNDALLKAKGCSWFDLRRWSFHEAHTSPPEIAASIQKIIAGMDQFRPWFLKDPRLCLLLPAWLPWLEVPIAVIVYRDPVEIAISMDARNKMPLEYGLALWEYYAVGLLNNTLNMPRLYVQHADLLQKPVKTCEAIYTQLAAYGVRRLAMPDAREIRAFIDPALYRARHHGQSLALNGQQQALVAMLKGDMAPPGQLTVSDASKRMMQSPPPITL